MRWNLLADELAEDLRNGFRQIARNPGFTAIAVLTLALGIGANTALFSIFNSLILRPLPVRDPGQSRAADQRVMVLSDLGRNQGTRGRAVRRRPRVVPPGV